MLKKVIAVDQQNLAHRCFRDLVQYVGAGATYTNDCDTLAFQPGGKVPDPNAIRCSLQIVEYAISSSSPAILRIVAIWPGDSRPSFLAGSAYMRYSSVGKSGINWMLVGESDSSLSKSTFSAGAS